METSTAASPAQRQSSRRPALVARVSGLLHAGVAAESYERDTLERPHRYVTRPALAEPNLSMIVGGRIRLALTSPWRDGITQVIYGPLDSIGRVATLVRTFLQGANCAGTNNCDGQVLAGSCPTSSRISDNPKVRCP